MELPPAPSGTVPLSMQRRCPHARPPPASGLTPLSQRPFSPLFHPRPLWFGTVFGVFQGLTQVFPFVPKGMSLSPEPPEPNTVCVVTVTAVCVCLPAEQERGLSSSLVHSGHICKWLLKLKR